MIPWLEAHDPFPPLSAAQSGGLLAASGDLTPFRLLDAYHKGVFPWFSAGDPVLWWSPDPRAVLFPDEFRLSRSLRRTLRRGDFCVRLDTAFSQVMDACASVPRPGQDDTWITADIKSAYGALHQAGRAHSVETWRVDADGGKTLIGGLYGVAIGRMFYGESMFAHSADASKIAFAHLIRYLRQHRFGLLDCQVRTRHLVSLGAREIPRPEFIERLSRLTQADLPPGLWPEEGAAQPWRDEALA
ncbi:MAG: leucyl/phenylalanyl-tRNA--protein transferase [Zoogloeaceae bacterium]|jgi:leucyl/phenylalanyl-tRNA--protein transferase|nr:leucyl/phenylalanyl-tRNA--protein transferase [Zoogloeaceae bacterium]